MKPLSVSSGIAAVLVSLATAGSAAAEPCRKVEGASQRLEWNPSSGATTYDLELAFDPSFTEDVSPLRVDGPSVSIALTTGTHYWRVRPSSGKGEEKAWVTSCIEVAHGLPPVVKKPVQKAKRIELKKEKAPPPAPVEKVEVPVEPVAAESAEPPEPPVVITAWAAGGVTGLRLLTAVEGVEVKRSDTAYGGSAGLDLGIGRSWAFGVEIEQVSVKAAAGSSAFSTGSTSFKITHAFAEGSVRPLVRVGLDRLALPRAKLGADAKAKIAKANVDVYAFGAGVGADVGKRDVVTAICEFNVGAASREVELLRTRVLTAELDLEHQLAIDHLAVVGGIRHVRSIIDYQDQATDVGSMDMRRFGLTLGLGLVF